MKSYEEIYEKYDELRREFHVNLNHKTQIKIKMLEWVLGIDEKDGYIRITAPAFEYGITKDGREIKLEEVSMMGGTIITADKPPFNNLAIQAGQKLVEKEAKK